MQENIHKVGVIQENMHTLGGDSGWRQRGASENSVSVLNSGVMQEIITLISAACILD